MQRWVITGCNGYLGRELCRSLITEGQVLGICRSMHNIQDLRDMGVRCYSYKEMPKIIKSGDVFVHCAGKTTNTGSWKEFKTTNSDWAVELYSLAESMGVTCFIYISSVAALGYKNRTGHDILTELDSPELCRGELYGSSKCLAEQRLCEKDAGFSTRLVILRPGLIYGHRYIPNPQNWFWRGWLADSRQRVPLVHIDNFIHAILKVAYNSEVRGVFHVVDDEQPQLQELNNIKIKLGLIQYRPWLIGRLGFCLLYISKLAVRKLFGCKRNIQPGYWQAALRFYCRRSLYSTEALRKKTGWSPKVTLIQGWGRIANEILDIKPNQNTSQ